MFRAKRKGFTAVVVSLLACFVAATAQAARSAKPSGDARLTAAARLMAGWRGPQVSHYVFARTPAWKEHSEFMRAVWARMNDRQVAAMTAWRDARLSQTCPAGRTLMYPFSGPDFFNAYWLFPRCETIVMFGLEHIGEVPDIEAMNERTILLLLADVRTAMSSFLARNYFITGSMAQQLRTSQRHGVLPLLMVSMALTD